ncbi:8720_t:CDS:2, partial [Funneliformis geosporum]
MGLVKRFIAMLKGFFKLVIISNNRTCDLNFEDKLDAFNKQEEEQTVELQIDTFKDLYEDDKVLKERQKEKKKECEVLNLEIEDEIDNFVTTINPLYILYLLKSLERNEEFPAANK